MNESRALLLTDIVGSTQLSEQIGDHAMAALWAAHDRVARDLLPLWRGREIDKTDGMLLLFDDADDAVKYALAYHRALANLSTPLMARAGLHVGPVILRENSATDVARGAKPLEVDGLAKPTAARVMSLAGGGQTLLTPEALAALGDTTLETQSHGHWVMKGVATPMELFEVGEDATIFAAPPDGDKVYRVVRSGERWLPVRDIPNNLPWQPTSFIGRERELGEIKGLLGRARLLTLLGMGGLGKTRLSLQAAAELMADYPDGIWFMDLAPLRDGDLVVSEAAMVLGLREEPGRPLLQTVCAHLRQRRVLFILDNCEHLVKPTAQLTYAILRAAPHVRFVASSREALRVPGEQSYPILPLPVPKSGDSLEALSRSTAVRLFVERAQQHRLDFALTAAEAPAIAALVARLEGIPLALELAAARVRMFSVAEINRRLQDRYSELVDGDHVLEERQQTLRALVDWSYDMLGDGEQQVFRRLAVFAGGFASEAAGPVLGAAPVAAESVPALLESLVQKSLVSFDTREQRYRMLETLRDYAREKLEGSGEALSTAARHCEHFFIVAKAVRDGLQSPEQAAAVMRAEAEIDNLRVALSEALAGAVDPYIGVKIAMALQGFWLLRGYVTEGRNFVRSALALPAIQASDTSHGLALYVGAALATGHNDHAEARRMLEASLVMARRQGDAMDIAATLSTLALARLQGGDAAAAMDSEAEALGIFQAAGDAQGEAIGHLHLGQYAAWLADDDLAMSHLQRGLGIAREIGLPEIEAECALELGELARLSGDNTVARRWLADSLRICQGSGNARGEAAATWWLGRVDLQDGDVAAARPRLLQALQAFRAFEMKEQLLGCLEDLAQVAALLGMAELAASLAAASDESRLKLGLTRAPRASQRWAAWAAQLAGTMSVEACQAASEQGRRRGLEAAVSAALGESGGGPG